MFSIKEVSDNLGMTPQAIYKDKKNLIELGYMSKNDNGDWEISVEGFNYLRERKIRNMKKRHSTSLNEVETTSTTNTQVNPSSSLTLEQLNFKLSEVEKQLSTTLNLLAKEQEEKEYFKCKFEEKDRLLNQYISTHLLPPAKTTFFKKFFKKTENQPLNY